MARGSGLVICAVLLLATGRVDVLTTSLSTPAPEPAGFGWAVAGVGDCDGDGVPDIAIADRDPEWHRSDPLWVLSGADGHALFCDPHEALAVVPAGDVNGDGRPDILVGGEDGARILSGADGRRLTRFFLPRSRHGGRALDVLGDLDGDGNADFLVVADARLGIFSGRSGKLVRGMEWSASLSTFGDPLRCVGDVDGDGHPEIAVPGTLLAPELDQEVAVLSSTTLECVMLIRPHETGHGCNGTFGATVAPAGDFDGDGRDDVLVAWPDSYVAVFSGRTAAMLRSFPEASPGGYLEGFGASMLSLGDLNGDRVPEIAVGCAEDFDSGDGYYAAVFDGRKGSLLRFIQQPVFPGKYHVVSAVGDIDRDGTPDLAVSLWEDSFVSILSGKTMRVIRELRRPKQKVR